MYLLQDAHNYHFSFFYFLLLIAFGSFFLFNVALAVVWEAFCDLSEEQKQSDEREDKLKAEGRGKIRFWKDIFESEIVSTRPGSRKAEGGGKTQRYDWERYI
jgi:hypothetical protein